MICHRNLRILLFVFQNKQKLKKTLFSELRFCNEKKEGYFCPQKCVKNKKFECGYLTLIKKLLYLLACKNQFEFVK